MADRECGPDFSKTTGLSKCRGSDDWIFWSRNWLQLGNRKLIIRYVVWDIPSKPGSISSTGSSPEIPSHTITSYNYSHCSDEQSPRGFPIAGHRYNAWPHLLEYPPDLTFTSIPFIGDPRTRLDQPFPRISVFKVVYTSDARTKLCEGVHQWCFNCRATETTTWCHSLLSLGKLVRLHSQWFNLSNSFIALQ